MTQRGVVQQVIVDLAITDRPVSTQRVQHGHIDELLARIESRRGRRNDFFHSTHLLDLTIQSAECVRAFVDGLDYCQLLFPVDWETHVATESTMETSEAVLRVDLKSFGDPSVGPRMNAVLKAQPRMEASPSKTGCELANHPEDFHLRLAIRNGGNDLRDRLRELLR